MDDEAYEILSKKSNSRQIEVNMYYPEHRKIYVFSNDEAYRLRALDRILWINEAKSRWAEKHPFQAEMWIMGWRRPNIDFLADYPGRKD